MTTAHAPRLAPLAATLLILVGPACTAERIEPTPTVLELDEAQTRKWSRLWEEQQATALLVELSGSWRPSATPTVIENVTVVPMTDAEILERQSVVVENGRFRTIGDAAAVSVSGSAERIDGSGLYLIPGLVDSHTHTISSPSQFLVYLTRGVTTLREMDGFPWMLDARRLADRGELLIPSLYVAGHILSHRPWSFYMTGVDSPEAAREIVREQVAAGYDFIKIHNSMPEPMFSAIFEAADAAGVDVAGHIPNEIAIADAIAAGFRTNEHFKGYIYDETLEITGQDFVEATRGSEIWHTPTFTTYHDHLRGPDSLALADAEGGLPLVPRWMRGMWARQAAQEVDRLTRLRQSIYPKSRELFTRIRPVTDRFLAGTDTGTYAYLVPGYALQEEVRIFEQLGMSPAQALATATVNPARAFGQDDRFGTIEPGKRADFVLLEANPLEGTANLAEIAGVGVRGVFLGRDRLAEIRSRLSAIFSGEHEIPRASAGAFEELVAQASRLVSSGWPYPRYTLDEIAELLDELGLEELAGKARSIR